MSFAEGILRLGCALVGWIVAYAYALTIAVVPLASCAPPDDGPWRGSFVLAVPMAICLWLVPLGLAWRGGFRWLALPLLLLLPLALAAVLPFLWGSTVAGAHPCQVQVADLALPPAATWHRLWAPIQLLLLLGLGWQGLRHWWPLHRRAHTVGFDAISKVDERGA